MVLIHDRENRKGNQEWTMNPEKLATQDTRRRKTMQNTPHRKLKTANGGQHYGQIKMT